VPTSSKLVVFDTQLPVSKAFFALVYNGFVFYLEFFSLNLITKGSAQLLFGTAAPRNLLACLLLLTLFKFCIGIIKVNFFLNNLFLRYYKNDQMEDGVKLEEHKISTWRDIFKADCSLRPFITVDPTERFCLNFFLFFLFLFLVFIELFSSFVNTKFIGSL